MNTYKFSVVIEKDRDGYFVHSFTDRDPNSFVERFEVSPDYQKVGKLMDCIKSIIVRVGIL